MHTVSKPVCPASVQNHCNLRAHNDGAAAGSSRDLVVFDVGGHRSQASVSVNQRLFCFA